MAKKVEELGFDSVWVGDSFVTRPRPEPLALLGAIAMVTGHVTIGTAALTAVLREPKFAGARDHDAGPAQRRAAEDGPGHG
ncbi:LLM class flavin-dependent oxidoreductase [Saccharothrix sp. S26]|nr:LLM class flavin-dependent oxidoreductase [Saccharothrix sp. S26]